jgi:hypothetical protein
MRTQMLFTNYNQLFSCTRNIIFIYEIGNFNISYFYFIKLYGVDRKKNIVCGQVKKNEKLIVTLH